MATPQRTIGILIFDDVEVLDFCGPFEVFATTRLRDNDTYTSAFNVLTIAEEYRLIRCRGGLLVHPHQTFDKHDKLDILVVPGGMGTRVQVQNKRLLAWLMAQNQQIELMTSVCTGAFLLAENGILDGRRATTHWGSIERMRTTYPQINVLDDVRVVDEGRIITSAGVSAGIDMSLYVVARILGPDTARNTARSMEYDWAAQSL
jgi:transcriptional regulator GlxA family with amidase domain